jgi:hypothetical protein
MRGEIPIMRSNGLSLRVKQHHAETSSCHSDKELQWLLDDRAVWTVNGPKSFVLGHAATLRSAIATGLALSDQRHEVVALVRSGARRRKIVIFLRQMRTLARRVDQQLARQGGSLTAA